MTTQERPKIPAAQILYGDIVYWITVLACIFCTIGPFIAIWNVDNNVGNPHYLFAAIFEGKSPTEVWEIVAGGFPGGHFWFDNFTKGDGFTQFGLALGCSVGLWGLLVSAVAYMFEKAYLYVILSLWVALLIFLSASGLVSGSH
jgi:hypothetical protein